MNNIKLVVSDLDGTLLGTDSQLTQRTIDTINKLSKSGIHFAIASGRSRSSVSKIIDQLNLPMYAICNNGANVYDKDWNSLHVAPIESHIVEKVVKFLNNKNISYNGFDENNVYARRKDVASAISLERRFFQVISLDEIDSFPQMMKLLAKDEAHIISKIKDEILKEDFAKDLDITVSHPLCLDIVDKNATKGLGIKLLADVLDITCSEIMAFGDADNDLHMLETAGYPIVMENGLSHLKEKFSNIAPPNFDDGVAIYLEKYFNL